MGVISDMPNKHELRNFGLLMGALLSLLFGLLLPWLWDARWPVWPWAVGVVFVLWGLLVPSTLAPVWRVWMKLAHVLGWINTRILLGLVFYVVVLPLAGALRVVGRDPMARRFDAAAVSYRVPSQPADRHNLEKPF